MSTRLSRENGTVMEEFYVYQDIASGNWYESNEPSHDLHTLPSWAKDVETRQRPARTGEATSRLVLSTLPPLTIPRPAPARPTKPLLVWTVEMRYVLNALINDPTFETAERGQGNWNRRRIFLDMFGQAYIDAGFIGGIPDFQHLHGQYTLRVSRRGRPGVRARPAPEGWVLALADLATLSVEEQAERADWRQRIVDTRARLGIA